MADDCIEWFGYRSPTGYGRKHVPGVGSKATHRLAWEAAHGPIPDGMHVLHRCDNPACMNVDHLFLGDQQANVADMMQKQRHRAFTRTTCPNGHPYSGQDPKRGGRVCRTCRTEAMARYRQRKKEQACRTSRTSAGG